MINEYKPYIDRLKSSGLRPTKQRLAICKILFSRSETFHFSIENLKKIGVTILLAEQNMHFCLEVAEEAIIIDKGKTVWNGSLKDLQKDTKTRDKYLAI